MGTMASVGAIPSFPVVFPSTTTQTGRSPKRGREGSAKSDREGSAKGRSSG